MATNVRSFPRKVAFVVNHAAFFASHRLPLAIEARRRGSSVTLLTGQAGSPSMEATAEKMLALHEITHRRVAFTSAGMNPWTELRGFLGLVRLLRELKPDVVHCASPKGILYGGAAARLARVPAVVLAVSGMGFAFVSEPKRSFARSAIGRLYRGLVRLAYAHPNKRVIVQNRDDQNLISQLGFAAARELVLIPGSGVDLRVFADIDLAEKQPMVLFPARMIVDKGVYEFVEAARRLRGQALGWRFVMAGAADYRNPTSIPAEALQRFHADGTVEWLGHVDDMTSLYRQASIVCLPSYYREGVPKALLEAAAAACAVITADSVGCREAVLPGITGELVPPRNVEALVQVMGRLIEDRPRRERYGREGRKLAEESFGIDSVVARVMNLYEDLLNDG